MQVIIYLRPGVDFSNLDNTLENIRWDTEDVIPPTQQEYDDAFALLSNPVPQVIDNWKGKAILAQRGLLTSVETAIAGINDPIQKTMAPIAFASANFTRTSVLLNSILTGLGQSSTDIDQLFRDGDVLSL